MTDVREIEETPPDLGDPGAWDRLLEALGPASLLVAIEGRVGPGLRRDLKAEDVLQEALASAWEARSTLEWRGRRAFRAWLLRIVDNRIRDLAQARGAAKRGGGRAPLLFSELVAESESSGNAAEGVRAGSTTPSKLAMYREHAEIMQRALAELPEEQREVVRLRLFEGLSTRDVADRLSIGISAVKHRLRQGAEVYRRSVRAELRSRSESDENP